VRHGDRVANLASRVNGAVVGRLHDREARLGEDRVRLDVVVLAADRAVISANETDVVRTAVDARRTEAGAPTARTALSSKMSTEQKQHGATCRSCVVDSDGDLIVGSRAGSG